MTASPRETVLEFISKVAAGASGTVLGRFLAEDFRFTEMPNALNEQLSTRNKAETMKGYDSVDQVVGEQVFDIERVIVDGEDVVLEIRWEATARMNLGPWAVGERMHSRVATFFTVRDGLISRQESYDVFFPPAPELARALGELLG